MDNTLYKITEIIIDKLEIIDEGGTYTEFPEGYLNDFQRDTNFHMWQRSKKTYFLMNLVWK